MIRATRHLFTDASACAGSTHVVSSVPLLSVDAATRTYGDRSALDAVSLDIYSGELYALIGPNGAGKTTLVRSIAGRLALDAGSIRIDGADPYRQRGVRRMIGLVPQSVALYPHLTARENLEVLGRMAGVTRREAGAAAERALDWIDLSDRARDPVQTLSGGMQRRLNIAAGTLHSPRLLLLDEPTVGVDPRARERIHQLIHQLKRTGIAVLLTTHDMDQVSELADRVGVLNLGRLKAQGTPAGLIERAFSGAREIVVRLAVKPTDAAERLLRAEGLRPDREEREWSGPLAGDSQHAWELEQQLAAAESAAHQVQVRNPDLRSAFFRLSGETLDL